MDELHQLKCKCRLRFKGGKEENNHATHKLQFRLNDTDLLEQMDESTVKKDTDTGTLIPDIGDNS
jgi:hypothetical protein